MPRLEVDMVLGEELTVFASLHKPGKSWTMLDLCLTPAASCSAAAIPGWTQNSVCQTR